MMRATLNLTGLLVLALLWLLQLYAQQSSCQQDPLAEQKLHVT